MTAVIVIFLIALCWLPVLRLVWWLTWRCGMPVPKMPRQWPDDPERAEMVRNTPAYGLQLFSGSGDTCGAPERSKKG